MRVSSLNGYEVYVGNSPYRDMPAFQRDFSITSPGTSQLLRAVPSIEAEEAGILKQGVELSDLFERNRIPVRDALRTIVNYVFQRFRLPKEKGIDIGSGATGEMVEELLPHHLRPEWLQMELSPQALEANRRRHPGSTIVQGSYLRMGEGLKEGFNIVTGLSSLDATYFLDEAIKKISTALVAGGYLVHIQDVRPGAGVGLRELQRLGATPPYAAEILPGNQVSTYLIGNQYISVGEIFRRQLGRVLDANPGMEVLMNDWVTVQKFRQRTDMSLWYFMNTLLRGCPCFPMESGPMEDVSAVVTVARKK